MKTTITKLTVKWMRAVMMMSLLLLLINSQSFGQNHRPHRPPHFGWIDSTQVHNWMDSLHNWIDSTHFGQNDSGYTWHDSGHVHNDTIHFPPPPPHDSGWTWNDSGHTPPPPPHDSGWTWNDTGFHFPPPPPHGGGDTIIVHGDTIIIPCGGHRFAAPNMNTAEAAIVTIYPNPVADYATMHIANTSGSVVFRMFDMNGRLAMEQTYPNGDFQINRTNFSTGVYYYQILDGNTNLANGKLIFQ